MMTPAEIDTALRKILQSNLDESKLKGFDDAPEEVSQAFLDLCARNDEDGLPWLTRYYYLKPEVRARLNARRQHREKQQLEETTKSHERLNAVDRRNCILSVIGILIALASLLVSIFKK